MTNFTLGTLGSWSLSGPSEEACVAIVSQPKRFALLIYLALARPRGLHRRNTLLRIFWPDLDDQRGRNALSQSLNFLRTHLPQGAIVTQGKEEVGIRQDWLKTDLDSFLDAVTEARWADAMETYGGEFLSGIRVPGIRGFQGWVQEERERLRREAARAAWSLAREQLERGVLVEAERTALRALHLDWTDEIPVRELVEAMARAGEPAAAMRLYDRHVGLLRERLALEPSPETRSLGEAIGKGDVNRTAATLPPAGPRLQRKVGFPLAASALALAGLLVPVGLNRDAPADQPLPARPYTVLAQVEGTAEQDLREAVAFLIRIGLDQAHVLQTLPDQEVARALGLMQEDPASTLEKGLAREMGVRLGAATVVAPRLDKLNDTHVLNLRVEGIQDDLLRAESRRTASREDEIITLVDQVVRDVLAELGEDPSVLEGTQPLPYFTTSSLEALRALTRAKRAFAEERDRPTALAFAEEAVSLDPGFAEAWRTVAVILNEMGTDSQRQMEALAKAHELAGRLPELERLGIQSLYYQMVEVDFHRATAIQERLVELTPENALGLNNLAQLYRETGRFGEALEVMVERARFPMNDFHSENLIQEALLVDDLETARWGVKLRSDQIPGHPRNSLWSAEVAYAAGDREAARRYLEQGLEGAETPEQTRWYLAWLGQLDATEGRLAAWESRFRQLGAPEANLLRARANRELFVRLRPDRARLLLTQALEREYYRADSPPNRPYLGLVYDWSLAGEPERARAALDAWHALTPEEQKPRSQALALNREGWVAWAEGRTEKALDFLRQASRAGHGLPELEGALGWIYDQAEMPDSALVSYHRYLKAPNWFRFRSWDPLFLARIYERLGQLHEAREEMEEAVRYHLLFIDLWREADPELQPRVEAARAALERIRGARETL